MEKIAGDIRAAVKTEFGLDVEPLVTVPEKQFGDFATNVAMQLASQVDTNPRLIADKIASRLDYETSVVGPGFINIRLDDAIIARELGRFLEHPESYGASDIYKGKVVVTEFSDPNPFKVLHMGHLYTSVVGDAISNLIEAAGGQVHRVNFGGDVGLHAAKAIWGILQALGGEKPERLADVPELERADWLSQRYVAGNNAYESDEAAKPEIVALNKRLYQITQEGDHDSKLAKTFWQTRQWSYDGFAAFYARIGVKFEKYYPESETAELGLKTVFSHPEVYTRSGDAVIFDGEKYGLHARVFVNSAGLPTYETKDLGCTLQKYADYSFDEHIIITASDITEYMKVVLKSIEQFAPKIALSTKHFTHGIVKLPGGVKQSSRLGNFVRAVDVLDMVANAQEKEQGNRDEAPILGATKYAFLKNRMGPDLIFDPGTSVSLAGNSGPYLQYSLARAKSILRKLETPVTKQLSSDETFDEYERDLVLKLVGFGSAVEQATVELSPHLVCTYLYELAQTFNRFYENCKVEGDPRQVLRSQLVNLYSIVMSRGLKLLGIPLVEKM